MYGDQRDTIAFLSDPATHGGAAVERVETHGSLVFLVGGRAYKLKRAVKYPYMDYSTAERRRFMCLREVMINRRTAPQLYLEIRAIVRDGSHLAFAPQDTEGALDHVIVMARFPEEQLLSAVCRSGRADTALMRRLAETLCRFHQQAEPASAYGSAAMLRGLEGNLAMLETCGGFAPEAVASYAQACRARFAALAPLLDARARQGQVRACHGDLHLDNVVVLEGNPVPFDAIEFNDDYIYIDRLYDLAFLLMDLERIGARPLAHALFNRYCECAPDDSGLAALPLFLSLRAVIRAHVGIARAKASDDATARTEAHECFRLAQTFLAPPPPRLIAIGGYSGTGKTTLARALAPQLGAAPGALILRSDVVRKHMLGVRETDRLPPSAYKREVSVRVFEELTARARTILTAGHAVILDAVYGRAEERDAITRLAQACGVRLDALWLTAPRKNLISRIAARREDASDATAHVVDMQLADIAPPADWSVLDASGEAGVLAERAAAQLERTGEGLSDVNSQS